MVTLTEDSVLLVIRASRPKFRNNHDKLAFAIHSSFLASGFVLVATGNSALAENSLSTSSNEEVGIDNWNQSDEEYAFVYRNPKNGDKKLLKCLVLGDKLMVDAIANDSSEPVNLEINVDDYVSETSSSDYSGQYKNLAKLVSRLESDVISKLDGSTRRFSGTNPSRSSTVEEPNTIWDDSSASQGPLPTGYVVPPIIPVGGDDLHPSPGAGVFPTRGGFGGGSMLVGPEDPRWFSDGVGFPANPGVNFPGRVPPGARYDPYGPPGVPGFEPDAFGRFPRGPNPGRGSHPPGRFHPDLQPPGSGGFDDYI